MAWKDVGSFFSQMGSGFLAGRNPAWSAEQDRRQQMSEVLRERLFNERQSQANAAEVHRHNVATEGVADAKAGLNADGSVASGASTGASRASSTSRSAANSANQLPALDMVKMFNQDQIRAGDTTTEMGTNIDPATGQQSGPLTPTTVTYTPTNTPTLQSGGQTIFPTTPEQNEARRVQGKTNDAEVAVNEDVAKKEAEKQATLEHMGTPDFEEWATKNPDDAREVKNHVLFGISPNEDSVAKWNAHLGRQYDTAVAAGDTKAMDRLAQSRNFMRDLTHAPKAGNDNPGTWSLQQDAKGNWVYFNNKTTETKPASLVKNPAAVQTKQNQAKIIQRAGDDLINTIHQHRDKVGNLESYWNQAKNNTPIADKDAAGLMTQIASFAALQPSLHGFRGQQALQEFEKIIGGIPKNADALEASIRAIQGVASIVENPDAAESSTTPPPGADDPFAAFGGRAH